MASIFCPSCRLEQPRTHRFCIRCGCVLPTQMLAEDHGKRARWFVGVPVVPADPTPGYLRVSTYRAEQTVTTEDGSALVPLRHVRFSVWDGERARCVLSLPDAEAIELATFIAEEMAVPDERLASPADRSGR